jgi:hypothetical protein
LMHPHCTVEQQPGVCGRMAMLCFWTM